MTKKDFPKGFSPYCPPSFYDREPQEFIEEFKEISRKEIRDGDALSSFDLDPSLEYYFDYDYDYDDIRKLYLVGKKRTKFLNTNYEKQLESYNARKKDHVGKMKEWAKWKEKWDANEEAKRDKAERAQYEKLRKKYEKA